MNSPDYWTGLRALRLTLLDEYPDHSLRDSLRQHLPPEVDTDRLCEEAGLDPAIKVEDISDNDCRSIGPALEHQPGWDEGQQFDRHADDCPDWVESTWESTNDSIESTSEVSDVTDNS